jgi:pyridoxamine 5'-phosphate oxidase family protein
LCLDNLTTIHLHQTSEASMSTFTPNELTYLSEQRIGRRATADRNGRPHVVPTGFNVDGEKGVVEIGGHIHPDRGQKRLYLTNLASNPYAAFVIDDLVIDPWTPRAVTVRGKALIHPEGGERLGRGFGPIWVEIIPERIIARGIDGAPFDPPNSRSVN